VCELAFSNETNDFYFNQKLAVRLEGKSLHWENELSLKPIVLPSYN